MQLKYYKQVILSSSRVTLFWKVQTDSYWWKSSTMSGKMIMLNTTSISQEKNFNFSFWNNYRFIGNCKDSTDKSDIPFTQFSPMGTSYTTIWHQNQETDIGTMCMYIVLCHFIICIDSCKHHQNQDTDLFHCHQYLPHATLYSQTYPPSPLYLIPGNH